jgi:hypothetical protein
VSVIARKIAFANKPVSDRPDASELAMRLLPNINKALCVWLSSEDIKVELKRADWSMPKADALAGIIMSARGSARSRRIAIAIAEPLVQKAAQDILQIEASLDADARAVLQPFAEQNMLSFGAHISETRIMLHSGVVDPDWVIDQADKVYNNFEAHDVLTMELAFLDGDGGDMPVTIIVTADMLASGQPDDDVAKSEPKAARLPPRLGPCHVDVQAIADHVRMSVADCSRLKIGQVIGLPGLRFDQLKLSVEMGEGPVYLTDASLGADKGLKAVRLNKGLDPSFRQPPKDQTATQGPKDGKNATAQTVPA